MLVLNKVGYKLTQYGIDKEKMLHVTINWENLLAPFLWQNAERNWYTCYVGIIWYGSFIKINKIRVSIKTQCLVLSLSPLKTSKKYDKVFRVNKRFEWSWLWTAKTLPIKFQRVVSNKLFVKVPSCFLSKIRSLCKFWNCFFYCTYAFTGTI